MLKTYQISFRYCHQVDALNYSNSYCCGASVNIGVLWEWRCAKRFVNTATDACPQAVAAYSSQHHNCALKPVPLRLSFLYFTEISFTSWRRVTIVATLFGSTRLQSLQYSLSASCNFSWWYTRLADNTLVQELVGLKSEIPEVQGYVFFFWF